MQPWTSRSQLMPSAGCGGRGRSGSRRRVDIGDVLRAVEVVRDTILERLLDMGIEHLPDAVTEQIEPENRQEDHRARCDDEPRRDLQILETRLDHRSPRWRRWLDTEAQEAQARFCGDGEADPE